MAARVLVPQGEATPRLHGGIAASGRAARRGRWGAPRPGLRVALVLFTLCVCLAAASTAALVTLLGAERHALDVARARVDRGMTSVRRILDDRLARMGDQAQLLALQPAIQEALAARDQQALNDLLMQARNQFGTTSAAAVVDDRGRAVAEQPPRAAYDFGQLTIVRRAVAQNQPVITRAQTGIEARPTNANPLNEIGLAAAFPIAGADGRPAGGVVLLQQFNDSLMQQLATATGLDVAVLTPAALIAGSHDVREQFLAPNTRPPGQRLAPVEPLHTIGNVRYVATSDALRGWLRLPALATPMPTPRGGLPGSERPLPSANPSQPPIVATLFVGLKEDSALAGLLPLRGQLAAACAAIAAVALAGAWLLGGSLRAAFQRASRSLAQLSAGDVPEAVRASAFAEAATLARALNGAGSAVTGRLQTLRDEVRKLEAVIDSVNEGIVVLDERSCLVTINETASRLLGLPSGVPAGTALASVLTAQQWEALRPVVERRDRAAAEVQLDEPKQAIVRVAAVPVHDDFARTLGRAIVLQDVTEERLLDNVRADFFTAMSHELRTPLSAIKGAAEVLLDDEMDATQRRFVETIHRNADRLGRLVTDLLDLGKLESGRIELRLAPVDLGEVVADVAAALQPVVERDGLHLEVRTPDAPLTLVGDHPRIEQIVTNLLANACQYTPQSGHVTVTTWREDSVVCLSVQDDGVGISAVDQQHLFDKFYQGVNALTHKRGGSGLGLTIVKHLTELHGGRIHVESKLGSGSTFTVRLPVRPVHVVSEPHDSAAIPVEAGATP